MNNLLFQLGLTSSNVLNPISTTGPSSAEIYAWVIILSLPGFLIFVLWVWSLVSTIMLNGRFKDFLDEYRADIDSRKPQQQDLSNSHREVVVEPPKPAKNDPVTKFLSQKSSTLTIVILLILLTVLAGILLYAAMS